LIGFSIVLLARAFYVLYVYRRGSRASQVITCCRRPLLLASGRGAWFRLQIEENDAEDKIRNVLAMLAAVGASLPW